VHKGVGRKISRGVPTKKDQKIAKKPENITIKPLPGGEGGNGKNTEK